jgi:predicted membrane protein
MMKLQEWIHNLEVGEGVGKVKLATALLAMIALTVWYDLREFQNFHSQEAMEAAQLARNVARGEGFTTQCVRPMTLAMVEAQRGIESRLLRGPQPDLVNPPLYPLLVAGLMKLAPMNYDIDQEHFWRYGPEVWIALLNQFLFFLTVYLAYRLARRLFDPGVAAFSAVLLLGCELLWRFSVSGLSTNLALLLMVCLAWGVVRLEAEARNPEPNARQLLLWAVMTGLVTGMLGLTRYACVALIIPVALFGVIFVSSRRGMVTAAVLAGFLVVMTPWLVRNYAWCGHPFGVAGYALHMESEAVADAAFPGNRLERTLKPDVSQIGLDDYVRKFLVNMGDIVQSELPRLGGSWLTAFFLVGLLLHFQNPALGRLRLFTLLSIGVLAGAQALGRTHLSTDCPVTNTENLMVLMVPLVFIYGAAFFFTLLDQIQFGFLEMRKFAVGLAAMVGCASLIFALLPPRSFPIVYPPYMPYWIQDSARLLQRTELMMSDMPWAVAWYGDRTCIWTTMDARGSFYTVNDEHKTVSALYLTTLSIDGRYLTDILRGKNQEWGRFAVEAIWRTNLPPKFPLRDARSGYVPDQLLLCDRPRWHEARRP